MKRVVVMWHGYSDTLFDDLIKLCGCTEIEDAESRSRSLQYDGSLDDFVERWKRPVLITPDYIAVTQFRNFAQR